MKTTELTDAERVELLQKIVNEQDEAIRKHLDNECNLTSIIKQLNAKLRDQVLENNNLRALNNALKLRMQAMEDKEITDKIVAESYK